MKIGIITIHYGFNFGSALQAYALCYYLNNEVKNIDAKLIDYIPPRYRFKRRYLTTNKVNNPLKKVAYLSLVAPQRIKNQRIFDGFLKENVPMTHKIFNINEARKVTTKYDLLITGSDQVWNSDYNEGVDPMYYLAFAPKSARKISYAASCGKDDYTENEWSSIHQLLKDFHSISLREKSTRDLFLTHGYKKAVQCLDPVFLLDKNTWKKLAKSPRKTVNGFVLVYCLDSDEDDLIRIAKEVADKRGLKTVIISYSHFWNKYDVDYVYRNQTPNVFLWLLINADYVVTNSFHGVAFSINLEKQFVAVKRRKYNNRLDSILEITGLMDRYINYDNHFDNRKDIDYSNVNKIKNQLINYSKHYLIDIVME